MTKSLVIVESPAKAKTIGKILGKDFTIKASMGHIRDLPASKFGIDLEKNFEPQYITIKGKAKLVNELKKAVSSSDKVYLATDFDREGEAIAWHLTYALKTPEDATYRITFNEITPSAVRNAVQNPTKISISLVNSQQTRRILDRIVGYKLSPLLWKKVAKGLSAGRVQSVAVKIIVEREKEIRAFKAEEYWEILATLVDPKSDKQFNAMLKKIDGEEAKINSAENAKALVDRLSAQPFTVIKCESKEKTTAPPPPYNTSLLQQQASTRLNFSTKKTMLIAQQLYEGVDLGEEGPTGLITYMRTDSFHISNDAVEECRDFLTKNYGSELVNETPRFYKSPKDSQQAHEAIRPTYAKYTPESLKKFLTYDQYRLYELVWKRFASTQMKPSIYIHTDAAIKCDNAVFNANGKVLKFAGYTEIAGRPKDDDPVLPPLTEGERLKLEKLDPSQHFTQPPPRYTEASMVKALEKNGIGRPSTYAPIISTIQERGYVEKTEGKLIPTELGILVTDKLQKYFSDIMDVEFTSQMESKLDLIEDNKEEWHEVLKNFYGVFEKDLEKASAEMNSEKENVPETQDICDKCGKPMIIKWTKKGKFLGCSGYPDCKNTKSLTPQVIVEDKCEKCGSPMAIIRFKKSSFLGCTKYPECTFTKPMNYMKNSEGKYESLNETCEKCGKQMVVRYGRRGPFMACSGYPDCKNAKSLPKKIKKAED